MTALLVLGWLLVFLVFMFGLWSLGAVVMSFYAQDGEVRILDNRFTLYNNFRPIVVIDPPDGWVPEDEGITEGVIGQLKRRTENMEADIHEWTKDELK